MPPMAAPSVPNHTDRELEDVFAGQSEIATAVPKQLKVKIVRRTGQIDAAPPIPIWQPTTPCSRDVYFRLPPGVPLKATEFLFMSHAPRSAYARAYAQLSPHGYNSPPPGLGGVKPTKPRHRENAATNPCRSRPISPPHMKRSLSYWCTPTSFLPHPKPNSVSRETAPDAGPIRPELLFAVQSRRRRRT